MNCRTLTATLSGCGDPVEVTGKFREVDQKREEPCTIHEATLAYKTCPADENGDPVIVPTGNSLDIDGQRWIVQGTFENCGNCSLLVVYKLTRTSYPCEQTIQLCPCVTVRDETTCENFTGYDEANLVEIQGYIQKRGGGDVLQAGGEYLSHTYRLYSDSIDVLCGYDVAPFVKLDADVYRVAGYDNTGECKFATLQVSKARPV